MFRLIFIAFLFSFPAFNCVANSLWEEKPIKKHEELQALPIVLKEKTTVGDEYIRLGDLFTGLDEATDKKIVAPAPALGKEAILTVEWLRKLARTNQLQWEPANEKVAVSVRRDTTEIGKEDIRTVLAKELKTNGMPEQADVLIQRGELPILVPANSAWRLEVAEIEYNQAQQTFDAKINLIINSEKKDELFFAGKAQVFITVPTARQTLSTGQIITQDDIFMKTVPQETGRRRLEPAKIEDLIGKEVKRTTRAGQIIETDDVRSKVMVAKGKIITLNFTKGGIMLSAQGKALENGGLGDTVRVMNTQSRSVVQGTVTGPETVSITSVGGLK